jgi:hypothetical protein
MEAEQTEQQLLKSIDWAPLLWVVLALGTMQAANWLGNAVKASLDGNPQGPDAELIGDREYLIDADKGFSRHYAKKKWYSSPMETVSE